MDADRFIKLSKIGEGTTIEYKTCTEQISESLYETVCSFLNHSGGQILVGVRNDGEIIGVNSDKAEVLKANIITAIKNPKLFLPCPYFTPQIVEVNGKTVIYLTFLAVSMYIVIKADIGIETEMPILTSPISQN